MPKDSKPWTHMLLVSGSAPKPPVLKVVKVQVWFTVEQEGSPDFSYCAISKENPDGFSRDEIFNLMQFPKEKK